MKELIEQLEQKTTELFRDARSQLDKGNKTAGLRARRTSLEKEWLSNKGKESVSTASQFFTSREVFEA